MSLAVLPSDLDDAAVAAEVAGLAGRLLLELQQGGPLAGQPLGDALAQGVIFRVLRAWRPMDAILSEEGARDRARLRQGRVWIVDPLDGTREFAELRRGTELAQEADVRRLLPKVVLEPVAGDLPVTA